MLAPLLLLWPMSMVLTSLSRRTSPTGPTTANSARWRARSRARSRHSTPATARHSVRLRLPRSAAELLRGDDTDSVYFQVLGARGERVAGDRDLPVPEERDAAPGEVRFRDDDDARPRRCAWPTCGCRGAAAAAARPPLVQVAETLGKRSQLATEIIKGVILPQFVILPLAVVLVWFALARGIQPLNELQQRIRQRASERPEPDRRIRRRPRRWRRWCVAINELLARLDQSIGAQKHFLADAAHQLKTPLAGLRMQAELAQRDIDAARR